MKFKSIALIIVLLSVVGTASMVSAETIVVDGKTIQTEPINEDGRLLVPLSIICEAMNASISWDQASNMVVVTGQGNQVRFTLDGDSYILQGISHPFEIPPRIVDGRTYVQLGFISTALGSQIQWNEDTKTVVITSPPKPQSNSSPSPAQSSNTREVKVDQSAVDSLPQYIKDMLGIGNGTNSPSSQNSNQSSNNQTNAQSYNWYNQHTISPPQVDKAQQIAAIHSIAEGQRTVVTNNYNLAMLALNRAYNDEKQKITGYYSFYDLLGDYTYKQALDALEKKYQDACKQLQDARDQALERIAQWEKAQIAMYQ